MYKNTILRNTCGLNRAGNAVRKSLYPKVISRSKETGTSAIEMKHFTDLAPSWWDPYGNQRILHLMNLSRLDFIQKTIRDSIKIKNPDVYIPGFNYKEVFPSLISDAVASDLDAEITKELGNKKLNVLDVGCGGGVLSESMGRLSFVNKVKGVDLTPEVIAVAKKHASQDPLLANKVSYELKAVEDVTPNEGYDIVTCFEMLEHVDKPSAILDHTWQKLKPNGILYISTINRNAFSWFTTIFMGEYMLHFVPPGTHTLSKYVNSQEVLQWFQSNLPNKHRALSVKGNLYVPTKGWVLNDCPNLGNYIMAIQKLE